MSRHGGTTGEPGAGLGARMAGLAASGGATALLMTLMYAVDVNFFLSKDKSNQYLPVARDIGRRLSAGEWLPVIDPNLGPSGNYALDIQYGLFDPLHIVVAFGLSRIGTLQLAAFVWALVFEVVLAVGTTALCHRLRMPVGWAAAAGFAAATCGWVFFKLSPVWIPGLVSIAWLPWLWWAWIGARDASTRAPRVRDCIGIAVFSYLVIAGGWPATWLAFAALLAGVVVEVFTRRDRSARLRALVEPLLLRGLASLAGVMSAALCLLPLYHALPYTERTRTIRNSDFLTGNLADMLSFAAPQLHGDIRDFGGTPSMDIPVYFAVWFAVVVLWCVRWNSRLWRRPGLVTSLVGLALMLLLTQAPSSVGPLRDQIRELSGAQFFFAVGVGSLACSGAWVFTRTRVLGILITLLAMGWISWARDPGGMQVVGIVVVMAAAAILLVVGSRLSWLSGATAVVTTFALTLMAFLLVWMDASPSPASRPTHETAGVLGLTLADEPIFAAYPQGSGLVAVREDRDGVGHAFSDLRAGARIAPGYSSIGQRYFDDQMCTSVLGTGCGQEVARLFQRETTTGMLWADLLGYRTILAARPAEDLFTSSAPAPWHLVKQGAEFAEYQRAGPVAVAGRITDVIGRARLSVVSLGNQTQTYRVASDTGARLIFRDLYWPGYVATLNGQNLAVDPLDDMLVAVRLPPGAHGILRVSYVPLSTRALVALPAVSVILLGGVCGWIYRLRRREETRS